MKPKAKISVANQPIASAQEIRLIDQVWMPGPVPRRFWEEQKNRRNYLIWLSHKLGCRKMRDLYRLTHENAKRHYGAGLAGTYWRSSLIMGIQECFPEYEWHEWLFRQTLNSFWHDKRNHRRYMEWLEKQLGIQEPEDWYQVTTQDFVRFKGGALLLCYRSSVSLAVKAYLPHYDWKEWLFNRAPTNFWKLRSNRLRYMRWLATALGIKQKDEWYRVTYGDFKNHHGKELLMLYRKSPALAVMDLVPRRDWCEWKFSRVPAGFWKQAKNRLRYMEWLGKQLKFHCPEDWQRIRKQDFIDHYGGSLVVENRGIYAPLVKEFLSHLIRASQN